jgi:peptidoglycan/LPS O-acetylase OafA/YrhL
LDALRGVAILLVVGSHLSGARLPLGGMVGVTLFFVLSGYLITTILVRERDRTGRIDLAAFYARRALRLLPALFIILLAAPLILWAVDDPRLRWSMLKPSMASLFYVGDFLRASGDRMVVFGHTWSLAVEEQFYLLWPLLLLGLLRWVRSDRGRFHVVATIAVACIGWRVTASAAFGFDRVYYAPDTNAFALLLGCLIAFRSPALSRVASRWLAGLATATLVMMAAVPVALNTAPYYTLLKYGAVAAGLTATVAVICARQGGHVFALSPLVLLGKISYGLYLWHEVLLLAEPNGHPFEGPVSRGLVVLVSLVAAFASWQFIERPVLRFKTRFERGSLA